MLKHINHLRGKLTKQGDTVLHLAVRNASFNILVDLIENGMKEYILKSNLVGETPLVLAEKLGKDSMYKFMLKTVPEIYN